MDGQKVERNGNWKERAYACTSARACVCVRARARACACVCVRARACVRVCVSTRAERADAHSAVGTVCCCVRDSGWSDRVDGQKVEWSDRVDGQIVEWNGNRKGIWQIVVRYIDEGLSAR